MCGCVYLRSVLRGPTARLFLATGSNCALAQSSIRLRVCFCTCFSALIGPPSFCAHNSLKPVSELDALEAQLIIDTMPRKKPPVWLRSRCSATQRTQKKMPTKNNKWDKFICDICEATYLYESDLAAHKEKRHGL